jgi:hypothetical protein
MSVTPTPDDSTVKQVTFTVTVDADGTMWPPADISYVDTARRRISKNTDDVAVSVTPVADDR